MMLARNSLLVETKLIVCTTSLFVCIAVSCTLVLILVFCYFSQGICLHNKPFCLLALYAISSWMLVVQLT